MDTKQVEILSNGQRIVGDLFVPENSRGGVLVIHGSDKTGRVYGARRNYVARAEVIAGAGFTVLTFDLRGYGDSEGDLEKLSISDHLADCVNAYDFLENITRKVSVFGGSYGGYLGILLSKKRKLDSLVLQAPAIYEDNLFGKKGSYKEDSLDYRLNGELSGSLAVLAIIKYTNSLYIIGSENDNSVPRRVLKVYYDSASSTIKKFDIIKGANHSIVEPEIKEWLFALLSTWYKSFK